MFYIGVFQSITTHVIEQSDRIATDLLFKQLDDYVIVDNDGSGNADSLECSFKFSISTRKLVHSYRGRI